MRAKHKKLTNRKPSTDIRLGLYWVKSDGIEDCFVIARNVRSAIAFERDACGFDMGDVSGERICVLNQKALNTLQKNDSNFSAPSWVGGKAFFSALGAEFRELVDQRQMRIKDSVFDVTYGLNSKEPAFSYELSFTALDEPNLEGLWGPINTDLLAYHPSFLQLLGFSILRSQKIETCLASSFIFIGENKIYANKSIKEVTNSWRKNTLGRMISIIRENWYLHPYLDTALSIYLDMRNLITHRLYTDARHDIETRWGMDETMNTLTNTAPFSQLVLNFALASQAASIDFANKRFGHEPKLEDLPEDFEDDVSLFVSLAAPRSSDEPTWSF